MHDNASRADLTGRRAGEIGQLCLALATSLREHPEALSTRMLALGLSKAIDRLALALFRVRDKDDLEAITAKYLLLIKDDVHGWLEDGASPVGVAEKIQQYGKTFYDGRWGLADPPEDLPGIATELRKLRDMVRSYKPDDQLVVGHASWVAAAISTVFHPNLIEIPDETLGAIRERALAAITFLENIAFHTRAECLDFLHDAAARFAVHGRWPPDPGWSGDDELSLDDSHLELLSQSLDWIDKDHGDARTTKKPRVHVSLNLDSRVLVVGDVELRLTGKVWGLMRALVDERLLNLPRPRCAEHKNARDMLQRQLKAAGANMKAVWPDGILETVDKCYILPTTVEIKGGSQVGIRKTRLDPPRD